MLMREKADLVEADLRRFYGVRLGDLWRFDELNCRRLTYRQIYVYLMNGLPSDSALAIDANGGKQPWSMTDHLLADLWVLQANRGRKKGQRPREHPRRPVVKKSQQQTPEFREAMRAAQRRRRERNRRQGVQ